MRWQMLKISRMLQYVYSRRNCGAYSHIEHADFTYIYILFMLHFVIYWTVYIIISKKNKFEALCVQTIIFSWCKIPAMMTESVLAGPNFSVISCLCLWTARWSSLVNLYRRTQMNRWITRQIWPEEERGAFMTSGQRHISKGRRGSGIDKTCLSKKIM